MHLHDETRDQARAQRSYDRLIAQHPRTPEADDARAKIETIANQFVPAAELSAAERALALRFVQPLAATPAPTLQHVTVLGNHTPREFGIATFTVADDEGMLGDRPSRIDPVHRTCGS